MNSHNCLCFAFLNEVENRIEGTMAPPGKEEIIPNLKISGFLKEGKEG